MQVPYFYPTKSLTTQPDELTDFQKECKVCNRVKLVFDFDLAEGAGDGLKTICASCSRIWKRKSKAERDVLMGRPVEPSIPTLSSWIKYLWTE